MILMTFLNHSKASHLLSDAYLFETALSVTSRVFSCILSGDIGTALFTLPIDIPQMTSYKWNLIGLSCGISDRVYDIDSPATLKGILGPVRHYSGLSYPSDGTWSTWEKNQEQIRSRNGMIIYESCRNMPYVLSKHSAVISSIFIDACTKETAKPRFVAPVRSSRKVFPSASSEPLPKGPPKLVNPSMSDMELLSTVAAAKFDRWRTLFSAVWTDLPEAFKSGLRYKTTIERLWGIPARVFRIRNRFRDHCMLCTGPDCLVISRSKPVNGGIGPHIIGGEGFWSFSAWKLQRVICGKGRAPQTQESARASLKLNIKRFDSKYSVYENYFHQTSNDFSSSLQRIPPAGCFALLPQLNSGINPSGICSMK